MILHEKYVDITSFLCYALPLSLCCITMMSIQSAFNNGYNYYDCEVGFLTYLTIKIEVCDS